MGEFAIGQPVPRFEDPRLVQGGGRYVADMVFPGMAFGYVLRSPHAHARIRSIDTAKAKAAPGVLAVLTGADYKAAGFGDLPVPGGLEAPRRRARLPAALSGAGRGPRAHGRRLCRLRRRGDLLPGDGCRRTDRGRLRAAAGHRLDRRGGQAGRAAGVGRLPEQYRLRPGRRQQGRDRRRLRRAAHVVKHHFVINRVTAATMEPRGCIGVYEPADGRYTIYTTLQRTNVFQTELSQFVLKVPDNKIRVVCGDIGGSFGMKSAVYNEVALVLLGAKLTGRPVKWVATRSESFLCDAQARDNVTDAELALDKDGNFLGFRAKIIAAIGAYLQVGMPAFTGNLGTLAGVYRTPASHVDVTAVFTHTQPVRPYRGNGRPEAGYVIERMVDLAADQTRHRSGRTAPAQHHSAERDAVQDQRHLHLRLRRVRKEHGPGARRRRQARLRGAPRASRARTASCAASAFPTPSSARPPPASKAPRSGSTAPARCRSFPAASTRARATRPRSSRSSATGSASIRTRSPISRATPTRCFSPKAPAARARRRSPARPSPWRRRRSRPRPRRSPPTCSRSTSADIKFADGVFSSQKTNQTLTIKEVAKASLDPKNLPPGMEPGLIEKAIYTGKVASYPNGCHVCELEIDEDTGEVEIVHYNVVDDVGTVINPLLLHGQIDGGIAMGVGQILMEDIKFDEQGQILTGSFMDYAMPRAGDLTGFHVESNPVPTKTNPLGVKGAGEAGCVGAMPAVANALVDALSVLGIKHIEMPATPEVMWRAIHERARKAHSGTLPSRLWV